MPSITTVTSGRCTSALVPVASAIGMKPNDAIPPKYAVAHVIGYIKSRSAIHMERVYGERKRNFVGQHFWARGYFVSTVGRDEAMIWEYIRHQEQKDQRVEQMSLWH